MKRITMLVAVLVFTAAIALAHDNEQHVMGTVTAVTDNSITVQTTAKEPVTVYTMTNTKYTKSGTVASVKDLKVGDRVVIHAEKMNDKVMANEVQLAPVKRRGNTAAH
jgi:Domain of unknown function (DUF5666)